MDKDSEQVAENPVKTIQIESHQAWPEADKVRVDVVVPNPDCDLTFEVRALSLGEHQDLQELLPLPTAPVTVMGGFEQENRNDPKFQEEYALQEFKRMVHVIDKCWKPLPGELLSDKCSWAEEHLWRDKQVIDLYIGILKASGFAQGDRENVTESPKAAVMLDPAEWAKQTQSCSYFLMKRPKEILRIKVKGISRLKLNQIQIATRPPEAPMRPKRIPGGGRGPLVAATDDPRYKQAVREVERKQFVLVLESALFFPLPGNAIEDKIQWMLKRPAGEVNSLVDFIRREMNYSERVNFS
jgi:hypothetical protein